MSDDTVPTKTADAPKRADAAPVIAPEGERMHSTKWAARKEHLNPRPANRIHPRTGAVIRAPEPTRGFVHDGAATLAKFGDRPVTEAEYDDAVKAFMSIRIG